MTDVGVKGVRDAKESVSCEVWVCKMVSRRSGCRSRSSLNGVGAYKACHRRTMSPCPVMGGSCQGCISCGSSRLKRPSVCSPVLPVNGLLEDKTKIHVAGVPLSSIRIGCRLGSVVVPSGCDDVVVGVWKGGTTCASSSLASERRVSLACRVPRLRRGSGSEVPLLLW